MKKVVVAVLVAVVVAFLLGWLVFRTDEGGAAIDIEAEKAEKDIAQAVETTSDAIGDAAEGLEGMIHDATDDGEPTVEVDNEGELVRPGEAEPAGLPTGEGATGDVPAEVPATERGDDDE